MSEKIGGVEHTTDCARRETVNGMSRAKSMLYLLNVNWDWIKQRPQYLAEALAEFYCIDVYEKFAFNKSCLTRNSVNSVHLHSFFRFPLGECKIVCVNRYCMNLLYAPYWGKQR